MTYRIACAAPNCKMRTYDFSMEQSKLADHNYIVSFHKFPVNEEKRSLWIEAAGYTGWNPPKDGSICSLHFRDDCFNSNQLYDFAVPTIFFDDFRGYLKEIITTMNLDVSLDSDHEDILSKSLKNISPVVSDSEEIVEYDVSLDEDDFEVECQEVNVVENNIHVTPSTSSIETNQLSIDNSDEAPNKNVLSNTKSKTVDESKKSSPKVKPQLASTSISGNPSSKLLALLNEDSFTKMSIMEPAKLDLVHQLINIIRMANSHNESLLSNENSTMGTYVITTKQEISSPVVQQMETKDIVSMVTKIVRSIKDGSFIKPDNMTIICSSPTIFLIRNVVVKNFDRNMNSVYVITTENLTENFRKLSDKMNTLKAANVENIRISPEFTDASPNPHPDVPINRSVTSTPNKISLPAQPAKILNQTGLAKVPLLNAKFIVNRSSDGKNRQPVLFNPFNSNKKIIVTTVPSGKSAPVCNIPTSTSMSTSKIVQPTIKISSNKSVPVGNLSTGTSTSKSKITQPTTQVVSLLTPATVSTSVRPVFLTEPKFVSSGVVTSKPAVMNKTVSLPILTPIKPNRIVLTSQSNTTLNSPLVKQSTPKSADTVTLTVPSSTSTSIMKSAIAKIASSAPPSGTSNSNRPIIRAFTVPTTSQQSKTPTYTISDSPPSVTKSNVLLDSSPSVTISRMQTSLKRKIGEDVTVPPSKKLQIDHSAYLSDQKQEIKKLEVSILKTERDITTMRKKIQVLKKRYLNVKNPLDAKSDEQLVEQILRKYVEMDAVQFFTCQMKVAGKACTQYRWTEEEKLFSLSLLYKNPLDYHILFQRYKLPSDKTLNKFVSKIKKAEADSKVKR